MRDSIQGVAEVETAISSSAAAASGQSMAIIKAKLAGFWPAAILGLGLVLTVAWNAALFCLLLYSVLWGIRSSRKLPALWIERAGLLAPLALADVLPTYILEFNFAAGSANYQSPTERAYLPSKKISGTVRICTLSEFSLRSP
jgi:hypothetical protein